MLLGDDRNFGECLDFRSLLSLDLLIIP